ncbi:MAG TPA: FG-GAP-like repeat-containing protein [Pyrinomonadaceae bacterium]|nr:FG-GAP-like repeat-containing protein [Pyrinomonadaceae bacterium]
MNSFSKNLGLLFLFTAACFLGQPKSVNAQCASPSFNVAQSFSVGNGPLAVASGDLNADTHVDLVTADSGGASISILLGTGSGVFGAATNITVGSAPTSVAIADVNGDTKPDLVVVNRDSNNLSVLLNNGAGNFAAPVNYAAGLSPRDVRVADFNGDGKQDLAVAAFFSNAVLVFPGDGSGTFPTSASLPAGTGPASVAIGDLNGDGKLDIAAPNYNSSNVSIFLGNGTGGFAGSNTSSLGASLVSVVFADFNTDGKVDLGIGGNEGQVFVWFGNGNGSLGSSQLIYTNNRVSHLATADLNNDGKADLIASHWASNTIGISFGNGNGTFAPPVYYSPGVQPWAVTIADLNHDSKLDIVPVNNASNSVTVLLGDGAGGFSQNELYDAGRDARSLVVADFNSDGKRDIAVAGYFHVALFKNIGAGRFSSSTVNLSTSPAAIVSADFNSDGFIDLAMANQPTNNVTILRGDGQGGFPFGGDFAAGFSPTWLAAGDFNNDGHNDLAVTNLNSDTVSILIGGGATNFAAPNPFAAGTRPTFVTGADLNNDGNFDLIVTNPDNDNISVLLGNGAGSFSAPTSFAVGDHPNWVSVADINGDGNSDLAVGNIGTVTVMTGNGLGGFPGVTNYTVGIFVSSVVISDFNGDNKSDLAVGDNSGSLSFLLNSGTGTFGSPSSIPIGGAPSFLAAADFNGDGAIDLASANGMTGGGVNGSLAILLNTCAAATSPPPVPGFVINDLTVTEGDGGTTNATVTVNLSQPSNQTVSVSYFTDGDFQGAIADFDFQSTSGRVTFLPGQTTRTITIPIIGDALDEFNENFNVYLTAPLNAPLLDGRAVVTIVDNDPPPSVSIADVSVVEGDSGQTTANFTVTMSAPSGKDVTVQYNTMDGTAISGDDYVAKSGSVVIPSLNGSTSANIAIQINGDINFEADQTFLVNITADNATLNRSQATGTILNDDAGLQFSSMNYSASESGPTANLTVTRIGNTTKVVSVDYATSDSAGVNNCAVVNGNASARCDYEAKFGTLRFASGETSKPLSISLVDDAYTEGNETFNASLLNPVNASISPLAVVATVTITDNDSANGSNPLANANFFVRQHYIDFLNREPDAAGLAFWSNQITECEQPGATCSAEVRRINVSAAFFLSIEFQETGYLVYKFYKAAYGNVAAAPVPVRYEEFLPDTQKIGEGIVVGMGNWQPQLENNKQAFALAFVNRSRFLAAYPTTRTPTQFVDALYANAGVASPPPAERTAAINEFGGAGSTADNSARARALRRVAENSTLHQQELNRAFVLMEYFGYLRRNPYDPPEQTLDYQGYNFWLNKLNQFNGNFVNAEMVKGFLVSGEYQQRFAP